MQIKGLRRNEDAITTKAGIKKNYRNGSYSTHLKTRTYNLVSLL